MRKITSHLILIGFGLLFFSCKKDSQKQSSLTTNSVLRGGIASFSVNGQLIATQIDTTHDIITAVVSRTADMHRVTVNFILSGQITATINGNAISSGALIDLSQPESLKLTSQDGERSANYELLAETDLQFFGLQGNLVTSKSLNRDYGFYIDQFDGTAFQAINCGPTSTSMALKWADSTFTGTPGYARTIYEPEGGDWYTGDVEGYLRQNGIKFAEDSLSSVATVVKTEIDNGNIMILCLNMGEIQQDGVDHQRVGKFYQGDWGHFILVKGYIQTDSNFYLECYDPYSQGERYSLITPGQLKGQDRYYIEYDIKMASKTWWPYAIAIAAKGNSVVHSTRSTNLEVRQAAWQAIGR